MLIRLLKIYLRLAQYLIILRSTRISFGFSSADTFPPWGLDLAKEGRLRAPKRVFVQNNPERVTGGRVRAYKRACLSCGREEGRDTRAAKLPPRGAFLQCL